MATNTMGAPTITPQAYPDHVRRDYAGTVDAMAQLDTALRGGQSYQILQAMAAVDAAWEVDKRKIVCASCGSIFLPQRKSARYCSVKCRVRAYDRRKKQG